MNGLTDVYGFKICIRVCMWLGFPPLNALPWTGSVQVCRKYTWTCTMQFKLCLNLTFDKPLLFQKISFDRKFNTYQS